MEDRFDLFYMCKAFCRVYKVWKHDGNIERELDERLTNDYIVENDYWRAETPRQCVCEFGRRFGTKGSSMTFGRSDDFNMDCLKIISPYMKTMALVDASEFVEANETEISNFEHGVGVLYQLVYHFTASRRFIKIGSDEGENYWSDTPIDSELFYATYRDLVNEIFTSKIEMADDLKAIVGILK